MDPWSVQAPENIPEAAEARALLARGLSLLGIPLREGSADSDGPVAIVNCGSGDGQSWAWRRSPERAEIYADSGRAAIWAVYDFLENSGLPLPPWNEAPLSTPALDKASERRKAVMKRRVAVFADEALPRDMDLAAARAFTDTLDARNHFDLGRDDARWEFFSHPLRLT